MEQLELPNIIDYSKDKWELQIEYDEYSESPREWENLGKFCCTNNCKYMRNESDLDLSFYDLESDKKLMDKLGYIYFPVSVYDHSGVSIYIGSPCDRWDSGQAGWYVVSKDDIRKWYNVKRITKKIMKKVESNMESEIKTYDSWVNGNVYSFRLYHNDDEIDSCCGFYDIDDIYEYMPKIFTDSFTLEQMKNMAIMP